MCVLNTWWKNLKGLAELERESKLCETNKQKSKPNIPTHMHMCFGKTVIFLKLEKIPVQSSVLCHQDQIQSMINQFYHILLFMNFAFFVKCKRLASLINCSNEFVNSVEETFRFLFLKCYKSSTVLNLVMLVHSSSLMPLQDKRTKEYQ